MMWRALGLLALVGCGRLPAPAVAAEPDARVDCPRDIPDLHIADWAILRGRKEDIYQRAVDAARDRFVANYGAGLSDERKDALRRAIRPLAPEVVQNGPWVCAAVIASADVADPLLRERVRWNDDSELLADEIVRRAAGASVRVTTHWETSGCVTDFAPFLRVDLERRVLFRGGMVWVEGVPTAREARVDLALAGTPTEITVRAAISGDGVEPGGGGLPAFHPDILDMKVRTGGCYDNVRMGVDTAQRTGSDGLKVWVDAHLPDQPCEGTVGQLEIRSTRPAVMRLYSVAESGEGLLVWPRSHDALRPVSQLPLVTNEVVPMPDRADERLVLVGFPDGVAPTPVGIGGNCRLPDGFTKDLVPSGAALSTDVFRVLPAGAPGCEGRAPSSQRADIDSLPECW